MQFKQVSLNTDEFRQIIESSETVFITPERWPYHNGNYFARDNSISVRFLGHTALIERQSIRAIIHELLESGELRWHPTLEVFVTARYNPSVHVLHKYPPNKFRNQKEQPLFYKTFYNALYPGCWKRVRYGEYDYKGQ